MDLAFHISRLMDSWRGNQKGAPGAFLKCITLYGW